MSIPCIIPARGGSKGIRNKNLVPLCGRPLIVWTIEQALCSDLVTKVLVATDSDEIANVARRAGAQVFRRSAESATDAAPSEMVLRDLVEGKFANAEAVVFLQATSPVRQPHDIDNAIRLFRSSGADSVFSARQIVGYTWKTRQGLTAPCHTHRPMRQQDDITRLEENGSIYVFKPEVLLKLNSRHGMRPTPYIMHPLDSFQIDEPDDLPFIEQMMRLRLSDSHAAAAS